MIGLADQYTVCYPEKDIIFVCMSGNAGNPLTREMTMANLEDLIINEISDTPLEEDRESLDELNKLISGLELRHITGAADSPFREELNCSEYVCEENPMGIRRFWFEFKDKTEGELHFENEQGYKVIPFGVNHNVFGKFPQYGYSNEYGGLKTTDGFLYDDAVSFAWLEEKKLMLFVQVIDRYFGNASLSFAFKGDEAYVQFRKIAENFMQEYDGNLIAKRTLKKTENNL